MASQGSSAFISYSREDSDFALRLAQDMKAAGAKIWLDQIDIHPGVPWDNAIEDALMEAPQMLLILSPSSARSDNVRNEISFALEAGKIIIPVLYMDCTVPLRLQRTQRIDFRADYAHGLASLLEYLEVTHPDPAVLQRAAEGDAQRHAAWEAREAEARRLADLALQQRAQVPTPTHEPVSAPPPEPVHVPPALVAPASIPSHPAPPEPVAPRPQAPQPGPVVLPVVKKTGNTNNTFLKAAGICFVLAMIFIFVVGIPIVGGFLIFGTIGCLLVHAFLEIRARIK